MASIIRPLPKSLRSSVRSGIFIFDSTRVVEELVFNSLDARATKVSVFVSVGSCYVKVLDDGGGITRDGLELAGERYATSKFLNLDDLNVTTGNFGFRGEALASISEVSVLEIVTRTCGRPNGYKKILKGCKCLYLGIDDDRKEVGTTVVVRDLFYNQPVRRKYIQSSPNKVLQSIKKCVMRLALVRPNISFKVVDIERENELFCTHSASSPLSLLTNGFGMEISTSLHDIEVEHDIMKLSGYISGPCNTLNMKALEYVYINSQFVCKGPIHKLLSQLAIRFEDLNSQGTDDELQNKKRSRFQQCPAYILNLSCPRSLYDLTFEPSKTYVQFKDWAPILDFIEKAIKRFWEENVVCGESSNGASYRLQEDQPWITEVNVISAEADISKVGNQKSKDCLDLFLSTSDKLTEDICHQTNREDVRTSLGYLHRGTEMFREQQSNRDFLCQAGYSSNLLDVSYDKCLSTVNRKHNSLLMHDNTCLAQGDYFVDGKFPAAEESFYESVPLDAPSYSHGKKNYDNLLDGSYAKCMSSVKRKHNNLLMYDKTALSQGHNFLDGKFPAAESFYDNVPFDSPCSSHGKKFLKVDDDVINESLKGDLLYDCHGFGYDVHINRNFQKPFLTRCSSRGSILHEKGLFVNDENEIPIDSFWSKQNMREDCGKDLYSSPYPEVVKKLKVSRFSDFLLGEFAEESCLPSDSYYTKTQMGSTGSDDQLLKSEWDPVYQEPSSQVNASGVDHITDGNDLGGVFRHYERVNHPKFLDDEQNECDFSYNMSRKANQHHCTSTSSANTEFDFDGAVGFNKMFNRLVEWPDCSDICSTKRTDILNEVPDWLLPEFCVEICQSRKKSKSKRDHFGHADLENNRERYRRSFSAPPFHKSKRRFFSLNQPSEMIAKRPDQMSNAAFNHREAVAFKYPRQSPRSLQTSTEDLLLQNFKTDEKQRSDVMGKTQVNDVGEIDLFEGLEILNNTKSRELMLKEVQESLDNRTKWRKSPPQTPKNDKLVDVQCQNNILDITSGFLHLAGDSLIPETISKKCLDDAKVLYQVDKKFIPVVAGSTLAIIDQHAADERIRLEELRQKVLSGEAKAITYLDAEQELVLPEIGYQMLHSYCEQIKDWGWICNIHTQNSESFKRNLDILHRLPMVVTLVAVPCILGVNLNDIDLLEFLQQLAETEGSSTMPPSVIRVLNSKACRGAIMFGDSLLPSECSLIVEELKNTSLCFQCAHGRPTTVPIVNLEALHNQIAKLGLMNKCSNDMWHGLHRHKVCVERATKRLCSARGS
ncbi:PREDICTED: DNA mismatch repair protein MLH3 isoform X1 [Lupinus angustifolius]|uniref:DNA mismatch repair protein MLH3 isoform X1 n=1 Tax=Lupinus angustifolius TaxID=3871 RepID=UPI00092F7791|nr:PREDICTED: DNA mismatch repair protein MLH3 isoform X1 [Lupinus angustifolius]XP_019423950.1 PREDICTED: DNA mismatch repair protein MLH3 isoform X1 [Lupinus angustifolius]